MSKKGQEIIIEKDMKKMPIIQNKTAKLKRSINKITNPRNKESFPNSKKNRIQINTKEDAFFEKDSFNKESKVDNNNKNIKQKEKDDNELNNNNNNENNENDNDIHEQYFIEENQTNEKPPNAIEINDLIGEKCPIELDILSINFNNYESSKTSSKQMGIIRAYGANTYQGLVRNYNEDRVSIIINMAKPKNYSKKYWPKTSFFGIYDGHGGSQCSEFLRDSLHKLILNDDNYPENVELAIKNGFKNAEKNFFKNFALDPKDENNILDRSGSCAVVILFVDNKIYVANVGDSRALLSENLGKNFVEITEDHKPNNSREKDRIIKNGGQVYQSQTVINGVETESLNGQILFGPFRVLPGRLSVSRTIGDIEAKIERFGGNPNVIICEPDIFTYDLNKDNIDFFIMGCDGIFDQMSNEEIIDCAWMVLNNKNNKEDIKKDNNDNYDDENEENESENIDYNFENYNVHEKCGIIVDFIIKSSMVRKSFDNVTCLMISLNDFVNNDENFGKINYSCNLNSNILSKPKKSTQLVNKRKNDIIKPKEAKISDNHIINNNPIINGINKETPTNSVKENIKLANFMNSKNNKMNNDNYPKTYRNTRTDLKNKPNFNTNTNTNIMRNNKIYIKKRKEKNLQKKKTNKTEIIVNTDNNTSNIIIKKILNKSGLEGRKTDINNNKKEKNFEKNKNIINKEKLNISQSQNHMVNNYNSPLKSKNNINNANYNSNNLINKLKHNKINKVPLELNSQIITNKNKWNSLNVHFYYSNTNSNNYKKYSNIKTTSIGNITNLNTKINHTSSASVSNNLNFHLRPKRIKNFTKPKTFRYSNNGLRQYKKTLNKNLFNGSKTNYSSNTHNISDNNNRIYSTSYINSLGIKNKNRGSISSRKKKYSYHQLIKALSMNTDNNMHNKINQLSNKKVSYSKEKDIQNFLYKNKTNIKKSPNENNGKKIIISKYSKINAKIDDKKIKKI